MGAFGNVLHSFTHLTVDSEKEAEENPASPAITPDEDSSCSMRMTLLTSHFSL
jgi:hypothetical protein